MKFRKKNILVFAREAGGAAAVAPVCHIMLADGWNLVLLAKDHGLNIFKKQGLRCIDFPKFEENLLNELVREKLGALPDIIFTSATSLPALDMTEKYLWYWGKINKIPSAGLLDQWQNYALRFSGPTEKERLAYMPDHIFVMDDLARKDMVKDGIPKERIIITGQPAFDAIIKNHQICLRNAGFIKKTLGIESGYTIVTFVAESLKKDFGGSLGYDEHSTLEFLGGVLDELSCENKHRKLYLIIKLHPENRREDFERYLLRWESVKKKIIMGELSPREVIAVSDIVIGMTSVMLMESILANKPTVSLQMGSLRESQFVATRTGAVPFVKTPRLGKSIIRRLMNDKNWRAAYLRKQKEWKLGKNAAKKCVNELKKIR